MLEKPNLEDEKIVACLRNSYGLTATDIQFLPLGYDSYAAVYRVKANGQDYFLKVKSDSVDELSIRLPHYLKAQWIEEVIAPLPTIDSELWGKVDHFTLILYPFIEGKAGMEVGLSDEQWKKFGNFLRKLHATQLSPELSDRIPKETFALHPKWRSVVDQLQTIIMNRMFDNPIENRLAAFWREKHHEITTIIARAEHLGRILQSRPQDFVVCHADIHTANIMLDSHSKLFVVDWDQPILAPRERDFLFVTVGGFVSDPRQEMLFFLGYGKTDVDLLTLTYYRYARAMEDIGGFGEQVFLMDASDSTKQDAADWLIKQFEPGYMVDAAQQLARKLSVF